MGISFSNKVIRTIERFSMLHWGDRICVAVSGGPDSVALLRFLYLLSGKYSLHLIVAHLNHGLRGNESERDEIFVKQLCESMEIPVKSRNVSITEIRKIEGGSIEDIGRRERYKFFKELSQKEGLNKIALGHNLNDQAETIVMRFLRGSGSEGLKGMLPVREGRYIRPFLEVTRNEIVAFLDKEGVQYVTDSSNRDSAYLRNRIRTDLIPALRNSYNNRLMENLCQMADILREEDDYFEKEVAGILKNWKLLLDGDEIRINISEFRKLHCAMQQRVIKFLLRKISSKKTGIGYANIMSVCNLINSRIPNVSLNLPFHIRVEREYDILVFSKAGYPSTPGCSDFTYRVDIPATIHIRESDIKLKFDFVNVENIDFKNNRAIYMDYKAITFPVEIRNIKPGDRMQPLGMEGTKKVKDIFIDAKIPKKRRGIIPLLVDRNSVLWIIGMKMNNAVRLTKMTDKVVKAELV
ncbi:MAG: tRNA lysidine(34) synthetase TilS [Deltaproteobacteria bacterium]|nr:tRNA lysidine(34) synthetase TilS [Deltaproteobacteria bacterium]